MNLYIVLDRGYDWCCFVFAKSRNTAKKLAADFFDLEYIEMRARTIAKNTEITGEAVVDDNEHKLYETVKKYGCEFAEEV